MRTDTAVSTTQGALPLSHIARAWWPLAASWLLMSADQPALSAIVARLPQPEINLAAYGGIVFPLALIIESPIIMLLSASTALSKDTDSYRLIYRFMMIAGALLTALHAAVAFTPLYYVVVRDILGAPAEIQEPARIGLQIMLPWTWSIGYRRFHQGVLIRFGQSRAVGAGTLVRLVANLTVLFVGLAMRTVPGIVVATLSVAAGVLSEAAFIGWRVRPVLRNDLPLAEPVQPPLTYGVFFAFYIPLVLTSLLSFLAQPIGSAALSRMPQPLISLAVWPVLNGLMFSLRSVGLAFNEVVVALLDEPGARAGLWRFTLYLAAGLTAVIVLVTVTPLNRLWFEQVSALAPDLAALARNALWLALPLPALAALQSWYQGSLLHARRTRGITEAVVIYLATSAVVLVLGVITARVAGVYAGVLALMLSLVAQTAWLGWRARDKVTG